MRVSSLRGTMRVYIKPPPSDQIWFGFSSMPDIDFNLEPSIGDHKITSGHLALFLISRFKVRLFYVHGYASLYHICVSSIFLLKKTGNIVLFSLQIILTFLIPQ